MIQAKCQGKIFKKKMINAIVLQCEKYLKNKKLLMKSYAKYLKEECSIANLSWPTNKFWKYFAFPERVMSDRN